MKSLEEYIALHAQQIPETLAVVTNQGSLTYSQLQKVIAYKKEAYGKNAGRTVVLKATQNMDFLCNYFAAHLAGEGVALIAADAPDCFVEDLEEKMADVRLPEGVADLLFTSGTTCSPKCVMLSHEAIMADGENLIESQGFHKEMTFIIAGPMNHFGCLSKLYATLMVGATARLLSGMKNIHAFLESIRQADHKVGIFLIPSNIKILLSVCAKSLAELKHKIEFIETGGDFCSTELLGKLQEKLPYTRLYNTYASTEAGVMTTCRYDEHYVSGNLGKALPNSQISISEDGHIVCTGKTVFSGYLILDGNGFEVELRGGDPYVSGDLGVLDAEGNLLFRSRDNDIIKTGGYSVCPQEVETAALELPEVKDCICISRKHPILGNALELLVVPESNGDIDGKKISRDLFSKLNCNYKVPLYYKKVDSLKYSSRGKVNRMYYQAFA
jgi:long-chain acyl-CoA synthetase